MSCDPLLMGSLGELLLRNYEKAAAADKLGSVGVQASSMANALHGTTARTREWLKDGIGQLREALDDIEAMMEVADA